MVKAFTLIHLGKALPVELCRLEEREGAHDVGTSEGEGSLDGAVHMTSNKACSAGYYYTSFHNLLNLA